MQPSNMLVHKSFISLQTFVTAAQKYLSWHQFKSRETDAFGGLMRSSLPQCNVDFRYFKSANNISLVLQAQHCRELNFCIVVTFEKIDNNLVSLLAKLHCAGNDGIYQARLNTTMFNPCIKMSSHDRIRKCNNAIRRLELYFFGNQTKV